MIPEAESDKEYECKEGSYCQQGATRHIVMRLAREIPQRQSKVPFLVRQGQSLAGKAAAYSAFSSVSAGMMGLSQPARSAGLATFLRGVKLKVFGW